MSFEEAGLSLCEKLYRENKRLRETIELTLEENGHLADGEDCTLIHLKRAIALGDGNGKSHGKRKRV